MPSSAELRHTTSSDTVAAVAQRSTDLFTLLRVVYQPARIIVGYFQVVTQIGLVLDLDFPPQMDKILDFLKLLAIDFQILELDCMTGGRLDFYNKWVVQVFVLPAVTLFVVGLQYCYKRRQSGAEVAAGYLKTNTFVVIFFMYPSLCNTAFSMINCRDLGPGVSVLIKDYRIDCSTDRHETYRFVAGAYIVVVAFGVPLFIGWQMVQRMQEYTTGDRGGGSRFVARRVADELKLDDTVAADAIRDVSTGREYSFLVNAYKPRYFYWEGYDMVRKLMLVGMLVVVGRGSVAQLFLANTISFGSFALQVKLMPYRHAEDNLLKAAVEIHIFLLVSVALALKGLRHDQAHGTGSESEMLYDVVLIISFVLMVPIAFIWAVMAKRKMMEKALREASARVADEQSTEARKRAIRLLQLGLTTNDDMRLLAAYFSKLDAMVNKMT
jgi:hypothetical protein